MGVELNLIRVLLMHNAKACKWQIKIHLFYGWQIEVYITVDEDSVQAYKHSWYSDKGMFSSSNVCHSNNPCMNTFILEKQDEQNNILCMFCL